jgi:hypothetical protein
MKIHRRTKVLKVFFGTALAAALLAGIVTMVLAMQQDAEPASAKDAEVAEVDSTPATPTAPAYQSVDPNAPYYRPANGPCVGACTDAYGRDNAQIQADNLAARGASFTPVFANEAEAEAAWAAGGYQSEPMPADMAAKICAAQGTHCA